MKLSVLVEMRRHSIRILQKSKISPPVLSLKYTQSYFPDIDETDETKEDSDDLGQENYVFECNLVIIYFKLNFSNKYYIHA